jgi:hypothetical protein
MPMPTRPRDAGTYRAHKHLTQNTGLQGGSFPTSDRDLNPGRLNCSPSSYRLSYAYVREKCPLIFFFRVCTKNGALNLVFTKRP